MAKSTLLDEWPGVQAKRKKERLKSPKTAWVKPVVYGALNIASASGIVFANKVVFSTYNFKYTCALTWVHTVVTLLGMQLFLSAGMFNRKPLPQVQLIPLALSYVGYIVLCNMSLNINTVGFYQVMKIAVAPTVLLLELIFFGKVPPPRIVAAVTLVCVGIGVATVTDNKLIKNALGLLVGLAATLVTALYQIWVGTKQKSLRASSMQLLHQYTPQATLMLGLLMPIMEPLGLLHKTPDTILGYPYTLPAVTAILLSAVLGLLVSLSTFLVIGATSSLTYNVVGHLKTIIILSGGCLFFGDEMPPKKLAGVSIAMAGIVWYTNLKLASSSSSSSSSSTRSSVAGDPDDILPTTNSSSSSVDVIVNGTSIDPRLAASLSDRSPTPGSMVRSRTTPTLS